MIKNKYRECGDYIVIIMTNRKGVVRETLIDAEDLTKIGELNVSWYASWNIKTQSYYARASGKYVDRNGKKAQITHYLHREILDAEGKKGEIYVDHKNHNTLDNRKYNLRKSNNKENSSNRTKANKNNKTSGCRNVCLDKRTDEWKVQLQVEGKNTILKRFPYDELEDAKTYAKSKRKEIYGEYADGIE